MRPISMKKNRPLPLGIGRSERAKLGKRVGSSGASKRLAMKWLRSAEKTWLMASATEHLCHRRCVKSSGGGVHMASGLLSCVELRFRMKAWLSSWHRRLPALLTANVDEVSMSECWSMGASGGRDGGFHLVWPSSSTPDVALAAASVVVSAVSFSRLRIIQMPPCVPVIDVFDSS